MTEEKKEQEEKKPENKKEKKPELSEEDAQLKKDIELIVERTGDSDAGVQKLALESLRDQLKTTESFTQIPKPLKFLRPFYETLQENYEKYPANKSIFSEILSLLAMTTAKPGFRDCLKYKLQGDLTQLGLWGHEYVRYLGGEIGQEFQKRLADSLEEGYELPNIEDLQPLIDYIIPYMIKSLAEPEACDLLVEVQQLETIIKFADKSNYQRICLYLLNMSNYMLQEEGIKMLKVTYSIYIALQKFPEAMRIALKINDKKLIEDTFKLTTDETTLKQIAFMLARRQISVDTQDGELEEIMTNAKLWEHFQFLAKELDALEPKTPEDIFKTHLTENRSTLTQNVDSARKNLASTFVNGFVNAGFGSDKLMTTEGNKWLFKNKDHGMLSAAASLGLIYLWNADEGLNQVDKYLYSTDDNVKAGALMAQGIINCGVQNNYSIDLLGPHVEGESRSIRIGAILGLGIAYAGTASQDLKEKLLEIVDDSQESIEIVSFAALALGMTFVGTCDEDICDVLINTMMERDPTTLTDTLARFLALGLGLLFLGKQDAADAALIACSIFDKNISLYTELTILTCAYAGSGNVYKIQQLFKIVGEHSKDEKENKTHMGVGVLGIALIALGEELGSKMAVRSMDHILQYADIVGKRAVPLALGILNVSNPVLTIMDTLSKLSHDGDIELAQNAIFSLGLIGSGTNNARIALLLRQLSGFYAKDANTLFVVRIAQGLLCMGKGLLAMSPYYSEKTLLSPSAIAGLLVLMHSCLDMKNILLGKYHYLLYTLACAIHPRFLITLDENLEPLPVPVRVGTAVDIVALAGRPKTITGFQTHSSPVLLGYDDRAELATQKYIPVTSLLEDVVILKENPDFVEE